jgi:hypothetical protein
MQKTRGAPGMPAAAADPWRLERYQYNSGAKIIQLSPGKTGENLFTIVLLVFSAYITV